MIRDVVLFVSWVCSSSTVALVEATVVVLWNQLGDQAREVGDQTFFLCALTMSIVPKTGWLALFKRLLAV